MTGSVRATRTRRPAAAATGRRAAPKAAGLARLQRKEGSCACGGGCPRCATESAAGGLTIGAVDDPLEREADRVADQVMAMRDPAARPGVAGAPGELLQRQPLEEEEEMVQAKAAEGAAGLLQRQEMEEEEEMVQAKSAGDASGPGATESVTESGTEGGGEDFGARVSALSGGGRGLPAQDRSFFEPRFGRDFGNVRLHTGPAADRLTREVGALAFTVGGDIAFRSGSYRPQSNAGRNLIAHELTHVVQQGAAPEGGEGDAEAEHRGWSRGPPRLSRAAPDAPDVPDAPEWLQRKDLVYGSGFPRRFGSDRAEVRCVERSNCEWFPSSVDFKAAAKRSGGGDGQKKVSGLLSHLKGKAADSIQTLGLLGHANSQAFALAGKIKADDVEFDKDGTLYSKSLRDNKAKIKGLRNRFKSGSEMILYGCNAGVDSAFLNTLATAFGTCVKGFSNEVLSCFTWSTPSRRITSRGRVYIDSAGLHAAGLVPCGDFHDKLWSLSPDRESDSCKKKSGKSAASVHESHHAGALLQSKPDPAAAKPVKPVPVKGRAQRRRLQRHPVYISRHGSQAHLDNAAEFFRQWGYAPITTGVDSIEQVVADLATKTSIGRVTLVSHAHPDAVMMSMLTGGPGTVPERDWRVDFREEPQIDPDAALGQESSDVLPPDPDEVVGLERHFLSRSTLNTAIGNARRDRADRDILDRIGSRSDPAVRQFLWWTLERNWLPGSGFSRGQQRRIRPAIDRHLETWRQAIVARANAAGTPAPAEADFAAVRGAIQRGMAPMTFGRVPSAQSRDFARQLIESPSAPVARVLQDPQFSRNLEQVRTMIRDESWIEIQGCRAGSSRSYLQAIQDFFGHGARRPRVTAPDWFQAYGEMGWSRVATDLETLRGRLRSAHVVRALAHWYPIVMGAEMPDDIDQEEALQRYLQGPNVLPMVYPGRTTTPGARGAFLIPDGLESDAYLSWLSRHSYRLTTVQEIRDAIFDPDNSARQNIDATKVDYLQENRNLPSRIVYRPDTDYARHIISA